MVIIRASQGLGCLQFTIFILFLVLAAHKVTFYRKFIISTHDSTKKDISTPDEEKINVQEPIAYTLQCSFNGVAQTCPVDDYPTRTNFLQTEKTACPDYFHWIHEDLKPWNATGITREMVERANKTAHFRLVIHSGKIYVENYRKSIQSRDIFTIWGFAQLLRTYPGMVPDVELMFDCDDRPVVPVKEYVNSSKNESPPPLFRYCSDNQSLDIVFPDWSFWGWPEGNIKPWHQMVGDMRKGIDSVKWVDREPYAYWKGNPFVSESRKELLTCNATKESDWKARVFIQDWGLEYSQGYKNSGLANQCKHRFKIYIEGSGWSVSQKYILACNSPTLLVTAKYHEFYTRSMEPLKHYWPIRDEAKCKSIKYAVEWGNNHTKEAVAMGKAASDYILDDVKMEFVYDYMYHLLREYAKLQRFEPKIPSGGMEVCSETNACNMTGMRREFMAQSLVARPTDFSPCDMPDYESHVLWKSYKNKTDIISMVEEWEDKYYL